MKETAKMTMMDEKPTDFEKRRQGSWTDKHKKAQLILDRDINLCIASASGRAFLRPLRQDAIEEVR